MSKDQEYGMVAAERVADREQFKSQISAISDSLEVQRDESSGYRVVRRDTSSRASLSGQETADGRQKKTARSSFHKSEVRAAEGEREAEEGVRRSASEVAFRPFMPKLGTDELSAVQRLDGKFQEMVQQKYGRR